MWVKNGFVPEVKVDMAEKVIVSEFADAVHRVIDVLGNYSHRTAPEAQVLFRQADIRSLLVELGYDYPNVEQPPAGDYYVTWDKDGPEDRCTFSGKYWTVNGERVWAIPYSISDV